MSSTSSMTQCWGPARARAAEGWLTCKPDGRWSVKENAGHLLDLEALWRTRTEQLLAGAATLAAADLENRKTHEAGHNGRSLDHILDEFRSTRRTWLARLDRLAPDDFGRTSLHSRLRMPIRLIDHLLFVAEHDDHHLAQIWELSQTAVRDPPRRVADTEGRNVLRAVARNQRSE